MTITWAVLEQLLASVPVTVYVLAPAGGVKAIPSVIKLSQI